MNANVIPLRRNTIVGQQPIEISQYHDAPISITIPTELAQSIRATAGIHCKDPQAFVLDWLKSGFPENAA